MIRKKLFSSKYLIGFLAVAILILSIVLFGCSPPVTIGGTGSQGSASGGSGTMPDLDAMPPAVVVEWALPVVESITGPDSGSGLAAAWGFDYGIKSVNESGGIRGVPARIFIKDTASNENAVQAEISTISSDALLMLAPSTETLYEAGEHAFYSAKMPAIGAATNAERRDANKPYAISCIADPNSASVSAVETWLRSHQFNSVYMFYAPINENRTAGAEVAFTAAEKTIVEKVGLGSESFDAAGVAEKAWASGAEAFYIDMNGTDSLRIVAQLKHLAGDGAGNLKILCGPSVADSVLLKSDVEGDLHGVDVWTAFDPAKGAEKRRAFDEAFANNVDNPEYYEIAVDYYQSAFLLRQAIEMTGLSGAPGALQEERKKLAEYLYDAGFVSTDHGDFMIENGSKYDVAKIYSVTADGFQL